MITKVYIVVKLHHNPTIESVWFSLKEADEAIEEYTKNRPKDTSMLVIVERTIGKLYSD